jgi:hypothetical protein
MAEPVTAGSVAESAAEAAPPEPSRPPLLFVERGGRSRAQDEDDEDEPQLDDDEEEQDDAREKRTAGEPVLLWPGPREVAPTTPGETPPAGAPPAEHDRPPSFVFLEPNVPAPGLAPRLQQLGQKLSAVTARWRTLPRNIRYGSPAAAAVLVLALVWWRVATGHEQRSGPGFVIENPPPGLNPGTTRPTPPVVTRPPRAATPRPTTPTSRGGTATPAPPQPPVDSGTRPPATNPTRGGAAVEPAHLFFNSSPWGVLYVDDRQIGNTPQADVQVPPGTHTIRIVRDGFLPYETIIAIEAGETLKLTDIVLQEKPQ